MRALLLLAMVVLLSGCVGDNTNIVPFRDKVPFQYTNTPSLKTPPTPPLPKTAPVKQAMAASLKSHRAPCITNCPVAWTRIRITADLPGPAQFQWFRLWASTNANMDNQFVFGTNRVGDFTLWFTNAQRLFTVLAVVDEALPYDSAGRPK